MIEPLLHRVVVKPENYYEINEDYKRAKALGLTIPELEAAERAQASVDVGVVVSIGPTAYRDYNYDTPPIKIGDRVNYARFSGKFVGDYVVLNDEDLICIVKEQDNE